MVTCIDYLTQNLSAFNRNLTEHLADICNVSLIPDLNKSIALSLCKTYNIDANADVLLQREKIQQISHLGIPQPISCLEYLINNTGINVDLLRGVCHDYMINPGECLCYNKDILELIVDELTETYEDENDDYDDPYDPYCDNPFRSCSKSSLANGIDLYERCHMDDEFCIICQEQISGDCIKLNKCGHYYHYDCMDTWLKTCTSTCPLCKTKL